MAENLSIYLLGAVAARIDGRPVGRFRSAKTVALLGYLICERRPVSRDFLADLLWPDVPLTRARGLLRRSLHDLNHNLPGAILSDYHAVQFNPACAAQTDTGRFEALRAASDAASLEAAVALCRGEFLEALCLKNCPDFETWLTLEREYWERRMIETLEHLLSSREEAADFGRAVETCWQILMLEPWREDIYRRLMVLLARTGNLWKALDVYKTCRHLLAEEMAIEPSDETRHLYDRIRDLATHPDPTPDATLPSLDPAHRGADEPETQERGPRS